MSTGLPLRADRVSVFLSLLEGSFVETYGVGMTGCLGVGSSAAKTLAAALNKPLVGVHHMVCFLSVVFHP
jgi:hypothetical protein